jgi:SAM-dependent methyltransferase
MDVAVFGCSKGAEVYSVAWKLRLARPDLTIKIRAIDIAQEIVEFARQGVYSLQDNSSAQAAVRATRAQGLNWNTYRDQPASPLDWMSENEKDQMFYREEDCVRVKSCIKEDISWYCADAGDPELASILGRQDVVVANRFLCHMDPTQAERILRNLARVVKPGGYLFVSGIDLEVRTRVALDMKWKPVAELLEEVHDGDPSIRDGWPFDYWAKEPIRARRRDATIRYASAFQIQAGGYEKSTGGVLMSLAHNDSGASSPSQQPGAGSGARRGYRYMKSKSRLGVVAPSG